MIEFNAHSDHSASDYGSDSDMNYGGDGSAPLSLRDLPELALPLVEHMQESRPDIVLANDRGARLYAFAVFQSWKSRYPNERFPGGGIDFLHISKSDLSNEPAIGTLSRQMQRFRARQGAIELPSVLFMDDWVQKGQTIERFIACAGSVGLPKDCLTFVTICGEQADGITHLVMDPTRDPRNSVWNPFPESVGVTYENGVARADRGHDYALDARRRITGFVSRAQDLETASY